MWQDPIIQEIHQFREELSETYGHDADAIFQAILKQQANSQRPKVSYAKDASCESVAIDAL